MKIYRQVSVLALLAVLLAPTASHAQFLKTSGISIAQNGGPILTDLGNGFKRWVTNLTWTNTTATDINNLYFLTGSARVATPSSGGVQNTAWNNALGVFALGSSTVAADNDALSITMLPAFTDVAIIPGFGVNPGDSLPAFSIGNLAAGASVSTQINFILSSDIAGFLFNGTIVREQLSSPVAAALPLPWLVIIGIGAIGWRYAYARRDMHSGAASSK